MCAEFAAVGKIMKSISYNGISECVTWVLNANPAGVIGEMQTALVQSKERRAAEEAMRGMGLQQSPILSQLFLYLVETAIERPEHVIGEHELARTILSKDKDFDPKLDSSVRVHMTRLRARLASYYRKLEGEPEVVVDLPKGVYQARFLFSQPITMEPEVAAEVVELPSITPASRHPWRWWALSLLIVALATGAWFWVRSSGNSGWEQFLSAREEPLVVFSAAEMVGSYHTGLRRYEAGVDRPEQLNLTYTGTGEVLGSLALARQVASLGHQLTARRSHELAWEDARQRPLILLGSTMQNAALRELQFAAKYDFSRDADGRMRIVNMKPARGEASEFVATPGNAREFALIRLFRPSAARPYVLSMGGLTTAGTQAAAEFMCSAEGMDTLMKQGRQFEAVLAVRSVRGAPLERHIVALHFF
jgi:hypothetical protein